MRVARYEFALILLRKVSMAAGVVDMVVCAGEAGKHKLADAIDIIIIPVSTRRLSTEKQRYNNYIIIIYTMIQ